MTSEVDLGKREGSDLVEIELGRKVESAVDLGRNEESAGVLVVDLGRKVGSDIDVVCDSGKKGGCDVLYISLMGVPPAVFAVATELLGSITAKWDDNKGRSVSDAIMVLL